MDWRLKVEIKNSGNKGIHEEKLDLKMMNTSTV
jgi:hypothetical protein